MRASRDELPELLGAAIRGSDWGDLRCAFVALPTGTDVTPLVKGLPDDRCSAPHWGYVIKGQVRVIYADHQEVLRAGDLYYLPSGHTAIVEEDYKPSSSARRRRTNKCSTSSGATLPWRRRQHRRAHCARVTARPNADATAPLASSQPTVLAYSLPLLPCPERADRST